MSPRRRWPGNGTDAMKKDPINALGFVEVRGLAAAIETADQMLKTAQVRLLRQIGRDPAQISLIVEGELGACRAAVDAGLAYAEPRGVCVAAHVIGRPADDTSDFVLVLAERGRLAFGEAPPSVASAKVESAPLSPVGDAVQRLEVGKPVDPERVLAELADAASEVSAHALAKRLDVEVAAVEACLETLLERGDVVKTKGRYRRAERDEP